MRTIFILVILASLLLAFCTADARIDAAGGKGMEGQTAFRHGGYALLQSARTHSNEVMELAVLYPSLTH
jgi:hypothetical protein